MRRFLATACLVAAAAVLAPLALAGNARPAAARPVCKPVSLAGKVASVATGSFVVDVLRASRAGRGGASLTVTVGAQTRVQLGSRRGALADLAGGQPVLVVGRACAAGVSARLVVAKAPAPVDPKTVPIGTGDSGLDGGSAPAPAAPAAPASPSETSLDG